MCLAKRRFSALTLGGETEHMYRKGRRVQIRRKTSKQVREYLMRTHGEES